MVYRQENIEIGDMLVPTIHCEGTVYYPLSYVYEKILMKVKQPTSKLKKNGYGDYLEKFKVDFSFIDGNIQSANCISKDGLIELLKTSNVGGLTVEQKKGMNLLLGYFDMDLINEKPRFFDDYDYINSDEYDEFEKDCIAETLKLENTLKWQLCKDCERYFPLHSNFFAHNVRDKVYKTNCNDCVNGTTENNHNIVHPNNCLNSVYNRYGIDTFGIYKNHNTVEIYKHYILNNLSDFPEIIKNKDDYLIIVKYLYDTNQINKDNITITLLVNEFKLKHISVCVEVEEIYTYLFRNNPREYPWLYKSYKRKQPTLEEAKIIFNNYITENNIIIDDIYNFDYYNIATKSRIGKKYYSDILSFVMGYYDNRYPAYKFDIASVNYWKTKENRNKALQYLIEEDMKLEIEKIPLYLTITSIRSVSATMYNVLKNYYSGIYEWVNEIYPDVFDPKDFDINYMRNEFDSQDEQTIDDILRENFENVLYNPRNTTYTIKFKGKTPDWFIFTDDGCIIVEYFGLWDGERGMYNSRTRNYIERSKDKLEKYKELKGYKFLYLYPEDLRNNFEGLNYKIIEFKN